MGISVEPAKGKPARRRLHLYRERACSPVGVARLKNAARLLDELGIRFALS